METRPYEIVAIDKIKPHPMNAKTHDLESIKSSLQEFGQTVPVLVSTESGYIIAGHGTTKAASLLGWSRIAVIYVDDLTPEDELRALAIHNRSGEAPNDKQRLHELLTAIRRDPQGLIGTGYDDKFADRLAAAQADATSRTNAMFAAAGMDVDPAKQATLRVPMKQAQAEACMEMIKRYAEEHAMKPGDALYEVLAEAIGHKF